MVGDGPIPRRSRAAGDQRTALRNARSRSREVSRTRSGSSVARHLGSWNFFRLRAFSFGASVVRAVPKNAIYVNVGQVGLAIPRIVSWLRQRPDVKSVFMLHDVIPLERPELVSSKDQRRHRRIVDRAARYASGLIASTAAAREAVLHALCLRGRSTIPVETVPLPVAPVFLASEGPDQELREHDYFVVCGTIEPRKNHHLLLNVWRELVRQRGQHAPKLVIVGSPGWGAGSVLDAVERCRALRDRVIFARGLSSPALRRLIAHAKALLMPSFAEGFGLPIIEALAVGTPVIASDLPAHREIAGDLAVYRDPTDGPGWLADVSMFADGREPALEMRRLSQSTSRRPGANIFLGSDAFSKLLKNPDFGGGHPGRSGRRVVCCGPLPAPKLSIGRVTNALTPRPRHADA